MNKQLAQYLFFNETLYWFQKDTVQETLPTPKVEIEEAKATPAPKIEKVAIPSPPIPEQKTGSASKELFKMKTKYLFVAQQMNAEEQDFLVKILSALNLSLSKVDLLIVKDHPEVSFKDLIYTYAIQSIVFLGAEGGGDFLPKLKIPAYQIKELKGVKFLATDALATISKNQNNEKRLLWGNLQALFA